MLFRSGKLSLENALETPIRIGTVIVLVALGWAIARDVGRGLGPPLFRRLDPATAGTVGFLIRLAKGSHVTIENARVNNEVWLPKRADIKGSVRIALVKVMRGEILFTFSDYKKFQTDSRVVTQ